MYLYIYLSIYISIHITHIYIYMNNILYYIHIISIFLAKLGTTMVAPGSPRGVHPGRGLSSNQPKGPRFVAGWTFSWTFDILWKLNIWKSHVNLDLLDPRHPRHARYPRYPRYRSSFWIFFLKTGTVQKKRELMIDVRWYRIKTRCSRFWIQSCILFLWVPPQERHGGRWFHSEND